MGLTHILTLMGSGGSNHVEILTLFALNPDYAGSNIVPPKGSNPPTSRAVLFGLSDPQAFRKQEKSLSG